MSSGYCSRAATDELLAGIREGRWRPRAWVRFLLRAVQRSAREGRRRPRALVEVTLLHAATVTLGRRTSPVWTLTSWALAITHLGMLERRHSLGWADALTLTRANMPTLSDAQWLPVLALASDLVDGRLARALGTGTPFGASADSLADAAFWAWFALRHEPSRDLRAAARRLTVGEPLDVDQHDHAALFLRHRAEGVLDLGVESRGEGRGLG